MYILQSNLYLTSHPREMADWMLIGVDFPGLGGEGPGKLLYERDEDACRLT